MLSGVGFTANLALELHDLDQALNIIKSAIADLPTVVKKDMCENGYSQRFAVSGKTMYKVALVFSSEGKGLLGWKVNLR